MSRTHVTRIIMIVTTLQTMIKSIIKIMIMISVVAAIDIVSELRPMLQRATYIYGWKVVLEWACSRNQLLVNKKARGLIQSFNTIRRTNWKSIYNVERIETYKETPQKCSHYTTIADRIRTISVRSTTGVVRPICLSILHTFQNICTIKSKHIWTFIKFLKEKNKRDLTQSQKGEHSTPLERS